MSSLYAVGSGLDIPTIVSQLVAADRAPTENRINNQGTAATAKLSALSTIKSAMSNLRSALDSLSTNLSTPAFKSTVAEGAGFSASSTAQASAGSYEIEVLSLARGNKLSSAAFASDERVGAGTLDIGFAGTTLQVEIGADATLSSVAREINRVAGGKGVTASVITSDAGQHLVLAATSTGAGNAVTVSASGADRLGELSWDGSAGGMTQTTAASQAQVKIDGQLRSADSNTFTDLVEGMTITLDKETAGQSHKLSIEADSSLAKGSLQSFVSTYNATLGALRSASSYNAETKTASALTGDAMVRGLQSQLRGILGGDNISQLKALGITAAKDGSLSFSSSQFDKVQAEQPALAASLLGKEGRLSSSLKSLFDANLDSGKGLLVQRSDSLNKQIGKLERELDDLDVRMEKAYERYTRQFTAMDTLVAQMQNTSSYLTSQLANLSKQTR
ncbi:flagellar filament capping protein FliD [Stenotrophomonas sp. W1S232]|uniref:Flagellar hook-associated protein 2 n=1 Tax=Stenotrophomonas koreensis TaxID=266128 RepID=A0A7W3V2P3_9GAMM|nr:flagellar filament capping protein FliD [Stenotrophomonas koreensis]MBB1117957.1 flagellar filament capping protein FliD [Stenotrophomonas koreensis]